MDHVVLLGDSMFDNAAYVPGGAVVLSLLHQLENRPDDATHLVVSAGGNDALEHSDILGTIYDAIPDLEREAFTALSIFNDAIIRAGVAASVPILDLRFVCTEPRDFSAVSPIEPSEAGGARITTSILRTLRTHDLTREACTKYC